MTDDLQPTGEVHPVAALFPMMADDELADLAADIKANGLLYPIVLDGSGQLIDGRNRLRACQMAGVEPRYAALNGHEPVAYILSANVERRHLSKGQAAMAVALACHETLHAGLRETAAALSMSHDRVHRAQTVQRYASELASEVMAGTLGLDAAYETAKSLKAQAQTREEAAKQRQRELELLREAAPDLADLVVEGTLTLEGARAELREREKREETERWAATKLLVETLEGARVLASNAALREKTRQYFDAGKAKERGASITPRVLHEASAWLRELAEEWR